MTDGPSQWHTRETLLLRVRNRSDERAWEEFVHYYQRFIYNIARRMNLQHHDAEEIAQAVNMKLWEKMPTFQYDRDKGRFRSWLATVVNNEVRMFLRKRKAKVRNLDAEQRDELVAYLDGVRTNDIEQIAEEEWVLYITNLAWENIRGNFGDATCQAFQMLSEGQDPKQVASELGLSLRTVYAHRKRMEGRLRTEIDRLRKELE